MTNYRRAQDGGEKKRQKRNSLDTCGLITAAYESPRMIHREAQSIKFAIFL
jgi:hypothetical protein